MGQAKRDAEEHEVRLSAIAAIARGRSLWTPIPTKSVRISTRKPISKPSPRFSKLGPKGGSVAPPTKCLRQLRRSLNPDAPVRTRRLGQARRRFCYHFATPSIMIRFLPGPLICALPISASAVVGRNARLGLLWCVGHCAHHRSDPGMHPRWRHQGSRIEYEVARHRVCCGRGEPGCAVGGGTRQSLEKHYGSLRAEARVRPNAGSRVRSKDL
jgi:hypothetical protein